MLSFKEAIKHLMVCGISGSGKTLTIQMLLGSVLPKICPGSDQRALIFDVKQDVLSLLAGLKLACPVVTLNPFDQRGAAWHIARDIRGPANALQVATILVPSDKNASQPFFTLAAQHLLAGVLLSLMQTAGENWTLRDVCLAMRSKQRIQQLLTRSSDGQELFETYFSVAERGADILATIAAKMAPLEPIAAAWSRAETMVSLRDWCEGAFVLVLAHSEATRSAMGAINRIIIQRASELILSQTESETRRTWIILDEVRMAGLLEGLPALMISGRSKGAAVVLGFQDVEGLRDVYGDRAANELLGQCSNISILRLASPATARWATDLFGQQERIDRRTSESSSSSTHGDSSGTTTSEQRVLRDAVIPSQLLTLPLTTPENGLTGYHIIPSIGAYRAKLSGEWITAHIGTPDPTVPNFLPRLEEDQYLTSWTSEDLKRLGLSEGAAPSRPQAGGRPAGSSHKLQSVKGFGYRSSSGRSQSPEETTE